MVATISVKVEGVCAGVESTESRYGLEKWDLAFPF